MPSLRLQVSHRSTQVEAGRAREVALNTEIAAFGPVAEGLAKVEPGRPIRLTGFLDRKGANQLELHVTEFGIVEE